YRAKAIQRIAKRNPPLAVAILNGESASRRIAVKRSVGKVRADGMEAAAVEHVDERMPVDRTELARAGFDHRSDGRFREAVSARERGETVAGNSSGAGNRANP